MESNVTTSGTGQEQSSTKEETALNMTTPVNPSDSTEKTGNGKDDATITVTEPDPYAYLHRNEFSSERFKIEVNGLPKHYGFTELKKLFNDKIKVNAHRIIPPSRGSNYMFINFKSEEDRQTAIEKIDGYSWKNKILSAKPAKAAGDPLVKKRLREEVDNCETGFMPNEPAAEAIRRVTTPWWNIPYEEQLAKKKTLVADVFWEMKRGILNVHRDLLKDYLVLDESIVENIKPSPVTEKYRNKCEFTIGYNPETKEKTVGFRLSSYKNGSTAVGPFDAVTHLPDCMVKSALKFQDFIQQSKYDVYDPETHEGCFRQLTVRVTRNDDVLLMIVLNNKGLKTEEFETLKEDMKSKFSGDSDAIKSFYVKLLNDHGQPDKTPPTLLFGTETISETLNGLQFDISPEAFFQVNVPATEVLYESIGNLLDAQGTTLLDVCSGTGTIGLSLASKCSQVLGIEMVQSAVEDARKNAELNSLSDKCDFFTGKAEDIIDPVIIRAKSDNIIAVVDPPRAGLHQKVLFTLRKCEKIQTLIYVACNAKAAMKNFIDLSRPSSNAFRGQPFIPVKLIPVDMFPSSPHFELIILFARLSKAKKSTDE